MTVQSIRSHYLWCKIVVVMHNIHKSTVTSQYVSIASLEIKIVIHVHDDCLFEHSSHLKTRINYLKSLNLVNTLEIHFSNPLFRLKMSEPEKAKPEISKFRTILPQILASTAKNLLLLDLGMAVSFPTIVIPALRGLKAHDNQDILSFTDSQASWFGKNDRHYRERAWIVLTFLQQVSRSFSNPSAASRPELFSNHSAAKNRWSWSTHRTSWAGCFSTTRLQ